LVGAYSPPRVHSVIRQDAMEDIKFDSINIIEFGNRLQIAGLVWTGPDGKPCFITQFPNGHKTEFEDIKRMDLTLPEWEDLIRQMDSLQSEMFARDETGKIVRTIYRKSQRQMDNYMQWAVFHRDGYACRYCGVSGVPMSVDHIDLYEVGGATIPANLLTACKSCNKERGNMSYTDWLQSKVYRKRSQKLTQEQRDANEAIVKQLEALAKLRVTHIRKR